MMRWVLALQSRAELADCAFTSSRECKRLSQENAVLKVSLRRRQTELELVRRDIELLLEMTADKRAARGVLRDAHTIDGLGWS